MFSDFLGLEGKTMDKRIRNDTKDADPMDPVEDAADGERADDAGPGGTGDMTEPDVTEAAGMRTRWNRTRRRCRGDGGESDATEAAGRCRGSGEEADAAEVPRRRRRVPPPSRCRR